MDMQTLIIIAAVAVAVFYVARSLWPRKRGAGGCGSCPANRNRKDDYA